MFRKLNYKEGMYRLLWDIVLDHTLNRLKEIDEDDEYFHSLNNVIEGKYFGNILYRADIKIEDYREGICRHLTGLGYLSRNEENDNIVYKLTKKAKRFSKGEYISNW